MDNTYVISASVGKGCYRHIRISSWATMASLYEAIMAAFEIEPYDAYVFVMRESANMEDFVFGGELEMLADFEEVMNASNCVLEQIGIHENQKFKLAYNFELMDEFINCRVLRETVEEAPQPIVIRSVGAPPPQIPEELGALDEDNYPIKFRRRHIVSLLRELELPRETLESLLVYFNAACRLYEIIPLSKMLEIYNSQNKPIRQEVFLAFAEIMRHSSESYDILGRESIFAGAPVSEPIDRELVGGIMGIGGQMYYEMMADEQRGKPYYVPPREEMMCYGRDSDYFPATLQRAAMERYLRQHGLDEEEIQNTVLEMLHVINDSLDIEELYETAEDLEVPVWSESDVDKFENLCEELFNNSRRKINRGYTVVELRRQRLRAASKQSGILQFPLAEPGEVEPKKVKVGRNDPCPCGSGKKYKKCCGR